MDQFRIVSRELVSRLCVEVSAGPRSCPRARSIAGPSLDRRALERCCHVRRNSLDVAGLASGKVGTPWRRAGRVEIRNRQLLDEQLLGRSSRRHWRRSSARRNAAHHTPRAHPRCFAAWPGNRHPRELPSLRRFAPFYPHRGLVPLVARRKIKGARRAARTGRPRFRTADPRPTANRRLHWLLQLAADWQRPPLPLCLKLADVSHDRAILVEPS